MIDAGVCRDIAKELIQEQGPLTINQIYYKMKRVFRLNSSYLVTNLSHREGGFVIDNGLVSIQFSGPAKTKRKVKA
jgi:hypothetical protein